MSNEGRRGQKYSKPCQRSLWMLRGSGSLRDKGPKRVDRNGRPFYPTRCHSLEGYHVIPRILKVHGRVQLQNEIPPHCCPVLPRPTDTAKCKISNVNKKKKYIKKLLRYFLRPDLFLTSIFFDVGGSATATPTFLGQF